MQATDSNSGYIPLPDWPSIRLVTLLLSLSQEGFIVCTLSGPLDLENYMNFEALSYEWGKPEDEKAIILDGKQISVRKNLCKALFYLRAEGKRTLWIDAICINQQDFAERNHQVRLMKRIYAKASRVLIWVGSASEESKRALSLISDIGLAVRSGWSPIKKQNFQKNIDRIRDGAAIQKLCSRSYWWLFKKS